MGGSKRQFTYWGKRQFSYWDNQAAVLLLGLVSGSYFCSQVSGGSSMGQASGSSPFGASCISPKGKRQFFYGGKKATGRLGANGSSLS
jgi:hypothetical protein